MKIAFYTLGCKLNQAETESLANHFSQAGYQLVGTDDSADIYVANTCTVTHIADRKSRHWLRMMRRKNPQAFIIATGCYAQRAHEELAPIADLVLGNEDKERLLEIVEGLSSPGHLTTIHQISGRPREASLTPANGTRSRSLIKIQDGCHSPCTYCVVPLVRPYEHSLPASEIIDEIRQKVAAGYKEVVLTGTKVGCYKDDGAGLSNLLKRILNDTGIERLRLSSLQPQEISPELLALWQNRRLCRHFHLALQSGSDFVLQRMKRNYSLNDYAKAATSIKEALPGVAITTDIMVAFPGESDKEFEQSYRFCQQIGFANIHVFPFSPRPGSQAAKMSNKVKDKVKRERLQKMLALAAHHRESFCEQFLGRTMPVLWEKETGPGSSMYSGLTDNYIRVFAHSDKPLANKIAPVKLVKFQDQGTWGELVSENPD